MRKVWIFLFGVLSGVALTFLAAYLINRAKFSGITFFDEPGEIVTAQTFSGNLQAVKCFEVFQVLGDGVALAKGDDLYSYDLIVLLWNDGGELYYDNQNVIAPKGKCFRQIGIYKYESKEKMQRTIPVVTLMDSDMVEANHEPEILKSIYDKGMTFFDEAGEVMSDKSYKVYRVVGDGAALARGKYEYGSAYVGLEVLLWDEDANYYDDQIVKAPQGMCFRQVGIYKSGFKTYPIVTLKNGSDNGQKAEPKKTTQKVDKTRSKNLDGNRIIDPQISSESSKAETSNPKLDKNKAYRLVRD